MENTWSDFADWQYLTIDLAIARMCRAITEVAQAEIDYSALQWLGPMTLVEWYNYDMLSFYFLVCCA